MAKDTVLAMYAKAARLVDDGARKEATKHALRSDSEARLRSMINLAQSEPGVPVRPDELDADPWLFNCQNGTIDLQTGKLLPHDPARLITKLSPVNYSPDAHLGLFEDFIRVVTCENEELAAFLQRTFGYTLTGLTAEEKLFFVHGPTGTGKSTMLECAKGAMGEYCKTADFESFLQRSFTGGPRNDIADLAGARCVISIEVDEGARMAEGLVKTLVGGDTVKARHLYSEGFEFRPQFKLFLAANHAPRVKAEDDAMWRRILRVPFNAVIEREKRSPMVKAILRDSDKGGPAFLAWAVKGCLDWQANGLGIPPVVEKATEEYRETQDTLRDFWADCAVFSSEAWTPVADLRKVYDAWADDMGISKRERLSGNAFANRLKAKGCQAERKHDGRGWQGIGLLLTAPRPTNEKVNSEVEVESNTDL
jgi:putative DNA primase/helicase